MFESWEDKAKSYSVSQWFWTKEEFICFDAELFLIHFESAFSQVGMAKVAVNSCRCINQLLPHQVRLNLTFFPDACYSAA